MVREGRVTVRVAQVEAKCSDSQVTVMLCIAILLCVGVTVRVVCAGVVVRVVCEM